MSAPLARAERAYRNAMFVGDRDDVASALAALSGRSPEVDLARGKLRHCTAIVDRTADPDELDCFRRAADGFARVGDERGLGEALFWQGCYHQVLADDDALAVPLFERAAALSRAADDSLWLSYSLRHLGIAADRRNDPDAAEALLVESTRLRRELRFDEGVAANLVGLASVAIGRGDLAAGQRHALEAAELAERAGASAVVGWAREALAAAAG